MTLQHQETQEPSTSEVVRLAQQLYERDRAEKERQTNLAAAAEEMGIPSEYLTKATAQLKARQTVTPHVRNQRSPFPMLISALVAGAIGLLLAIFLTYARTESPVAATVNEPPPPAMVQPIPSAPMPAPGTPMPRTEPAQPYPAAPSGSSGY